MNEPSDGEDLLTRGMQLVFGAKRAVPRLPERIADYRIIRKIGEGGMGIVYEAEQPEPKRRVAIKVIRGGNLVGDEAVRMFKREAHSLGLLDHPSIASIFEAGCTDEGAHYLVMELISGESLGAWLDRRASSTGASRNELRRRLELFCRICDAVAYAHQRGVIHRDLKPTNILVQPCSATSVPAIKVLDFGLAKLTTAHDVTQVTRAGKLQGTLPYMSPEAASGLPDAIDSRTDVYALGIVLYEVLTQHVPWPTASTSLAESLRIVCNEPPPPLSTFWEGSKRPDRDLETIVQKCLEKEVADRYQTASALSDDIRRFLEDQPIAARPPSTIYQLRKMVARNSGAFAALAGFVLLLIGFSILMIVQVAQTTRERDRANLEAVSTRRITDFLLEMYRTAAPSSSRGKTVTLRDFLEHGSRKLAHSLTAEPRVRARLMTMIGKVSTELGMYETADALLQEGLSLRRSELGAAHPEVADSLREIGVLLLTQSHLVRAREALHEALAIVERDPGRASLAYAAVLEQLGHCAARGAKFDVAESRFVEVLRIRKEQTDDNHILVGRALLSLGNLYRIKGDFERSVSTLQRSRHIHEAALGEIHPDVADVYYALAVSFATHKREEDAVPLFQRCLDIRKTTFDPGHTLIAKTKISLGTAIQHVDPARAMQLIETAVDSYEKTLGSEHIDLAWAHNTLGLLHLNNGDPKRGIQHHERALAISKKVHGARHPGVATCLNNLGAAYTKAGMYSEAERSLLESIEIKAEAFPPTHRKHLTVRTHLAKLYLAIGRLDDAETRLHEAREIAKEAYGEDSRALGRQLYWLACVDARRGKHQAALSRLRECLRLGVRIDEVHKSKHLAGLRKDPRFVALQKSYGVR